MSKVNLQSFLVIVIVVLQVAFFQITLCSPVKNDKALSEERIHTLRDLAEKLNNSIKSDVDPCTDYYSHVCGNFNESDRLVKLYPDGDYVTEVFNKHIKDGNNLSETEIKMKQFFESCENQQNFNLEYFLRGFSFPDSIGGWPAFETDWVAEKFDFTSAVAELNSYGVQIVIDLRVSTIDDQTYLTIVPELIAPSIDIGPYDITMFPRDNMTLSKLGVNNTSAVLDDYFLVEEEYIKVLEKYNYSKVIKSFKDVKELTPDFNWEKYLKIVTGMTFDDEVKFIVVNEQAFKELITALLNMDKKILANFFFYKFLDLMMSNLIGYRGVNCYEQTFNVFTQVFARTIVTHYFTEDDKHQIAEVLTYLVDSADDFVELYQEKTKEEIKKDIKEFIFNDYLSQVTDERITEEFKDLEIKRDGYYENILHIIHRNIKEIFDSTLSNHTKSNKMRIFLGESLTQTIYYGHNKPVSVLLNELDLLLLAASAVRIKLLSSHEFPEASVNCFEQQLGVKEVNKVDLWQNELLQKVMKAFSLWTENNTEINEKENEVLGEYGLSNRKLLLIGTIQETCRKDYIPAKDEIMTHQAAWGNLKEFSEEYNCPEGSPMNPSIKCNFL